MTISNIVVRPRIIVSNAVHQEPRYQVFALTAMEDTPPAKPPVTTSPTLDEEERVLIDLETRKKKRDGLDCFEVTMTSKMMLYIYKKPMKS